MAGKVEELEKKVKELERQIEELKAALEAANTSKAEALEKFEFVENQNADLNAANAELKYQCEVLQAKNEELEKALFDGAPGNMPVAETEKEPELSKDDIKLIKMGCKAYGIESKFVFKARIEIDSETGERRAMIVTNGGSKVRYAEGDEEAEDFQPLDQIKITGVNPKLEKRKPIAGKKKD